MSSADDLTQKARIRNAAVELFGRTGFGATVRAIAAEAGVSPALVIHHYGSKVGLRQACDDWAMDLVAAKQDLLTGGMGPSIADYYDQHPEMPLLMAYIAAVLREDGELADRIFDHLHELTQRMMSEGEAAGTVRPDADPSARAAVLVAWSCGAILLGDQLARHLGGSGLGDPKVGARYSRTGMDLLGPGVFTDDFVAGYRHANSEQK